MYRVFDFSIACDFYLPLPTADSETADSETADSETAKLSVFESRKILNESTIDWLRGPRGSGDEDIVVGRKIDPDSPASHVIRFPGLADFQVFHDHIIYHRHSRCGQDTLCHLLLDAALPAWHSFQGHLVIHASAVELQSGHTVVFAGESGWGKSTLAAALSQHGATLLSDDCIELRVYNEKVLVIPSYTGLNLLTDSIHGLELASLGWTDGAEYSEKMTCSSVKKELSAHRALSCLYLMKEPSRCASVSIEKLSGATSLAGVMKNSFTLDHQSKSANKRRLALSSTVIEACPMVVTLEYPRGYKLLPSILDSITGPWKL